MNSNNHRIYLDNAATTPMDRAVVESMQDIYINHFGNPSSTYSYGREAKMQIELARKSVAKLLHVKANEIFFTSGGTESINTAIHMAIHDLGCKTIISSKIEHHASLHAIEAFSKKWNIPVHYVTLTENGHVDLKDLERLIKASKDKTLVSLMHANNEIGNLLNIEKVGALCKENNAIFLCDTVQTIAHYPIGLKENNIHFATGAAHKFHGPKGSGILFVNNEIKVQSWIKGGAQERNIRAGTENIAGIVGLAKALELALVNGEKNKEHILKLRKHFIKRIQSELPHISFNGDWDGDSLYCLLNLSIPFKPENNMLLMQLDMKGLCVSGGSACSSGATTGSHVIAEVYPNIKQNPLRISFSKFNTIEEIDKAVEILKELCN
ncbi:MAG TPA: cysteine desulfurase family protein [Chitinophagaceae bacterium]|nr:cysteine desulfurase family protein [Chitinophagaceae bacterium]